VTKTQSQNDDIRSLKNRISKLEALLAEQKQLSEDLLKSKEYSEVLLNISAGIIVSLDRKGTIILLNDNGHELLGYKKGELIGKNWFETCIPQKNKPAIKSIFTKLMRGEIENSTHYENSILTKKGTEKIISWHNTLLKDADGNIIGLLSSGEDITIKHNLLQEVIDNQERYEDLYDNAPDMYFSLNENGTVLSVNKNGANYLGYKRSELIGDKVWKIVYKNDLTRVKNQINKILHNCERDYELEFRKVTKDHRIIFVQEKITCNCNEKNGLKELRIICRDITDQKKIHQKLLDYQENLKSMTHELNTIEDKTKQQIAIKLHDDIAQAMALSKITLSDISEDMPFETINKKVETAKTFLTNAIKNSRDLTYELSPPILHELGLGEAVKWHVKQIRKIFDIKFQLRGIQETVGLPENIKILLYKSVVELTNNIIKHSNASLVTITFNRFKNVFRITVKDNGVGFKGFPGKDISKNKKFGLFSTSERIKYIGGDLIIDSQIKKGAKITIKIPI